VIGDVFRDTVTCPVCGFARGTRVPLACCCRGWVAFLRGFLATRSRVEAAL
jgi:hypothetical protein